VIPLYQFKTLAPLSRNVMRGVLKYVGTTISVCYSDYASIANILAGVGSELISGHISVDWAQLHLKAETESSLKTLCV
jgi:hypothetical protein